MNASLSPQSAPEPGNTELRWRRRQILEATLLEPLAALNREFLELMCSASSAGNGEAGSGRHQDARHLLASLDARQRESLANCPFSLFRARFRDEAFWEGLADGYEPVAVRNAAPSVGAISCADTASARPRVFAQSALFFVWHVAQANPPAARLIFALSEGTLRALRRMSLVRLQEAAHELPHLFTPRWSDRPEFWSALLEELAVCGAFPARAHLLGVQMLAAEKADDDAAGGGYPAVPCATSR